MHSPDEGSAVHWTGLLRAGSGTGLWRARARSAIRGSAFGPLDAGPTQCLAQGVPGLREDRYLVVLSSPHLTAEERAVIVKAACGGQACRALPLVIAHCDVRAARSIASLPGVLRVLPALENLHDTWPIVEGLDFLAATYVAHQQREPVSGTIDGHARGELPGYPTLREQSGEPGIDFDASLDLATSPALMPVINFSVGTYSLDYPVTGNDAVNAATWGAAQEQLVVAAAGNCGTHPGIATVSAWARMPHVLAVGATTDDTGTELAPYSSTGTLSEEDSGPDLVACGNSGLDPEVKGTSYAAPRVTFMACLISAAVLQLRHALQVCSGQNVEGIRLVGLGMLDCWDAGGIWGPRDWKRSRLPAMPAAGPDAAAVARLWRLLASRGLQLEIRGGAPLLHALLRQSARPMPGYARWQVGVGFVSVELVLDRLAAITGADVLRWFGRDPQLAGVLDDAAQLRMFDRRALDSLRELVLATYPQWNVDWASRRFALRSRAGDPAENMDETERRQGIALPE